jgi:hypothetical protein
MYVFLDPVGHATFADSGKLGAIVAQVGFPQLRNTGGPDKFREIYMCVWVLIAISSIFTIPDSPLNPQSRAFRILHSHGHLLKFDKLARDPSLDSPRDGHRSSASFGLDSST